VASYLIIMIAIFMSEPPPSGQNRQKKSEEVQ